MYYCCGITEKGVMPHNEDALLIGRTVLDNGETEQFPGAPFIAAVSDGVSGERSGEVASKMCLEMVGEIHYNGRMHLDQRLYDVHRRLAEYSAGDPNAHNMQATLCGIAVDENGGILAFNVGDSRLYRFRRGRLRQISRDQSLVQLLYEEGSITKEQRRTHIHRNIIFPAFGNVTATPKIDITPIEGMEAGDVLLLCTDGLSDHVSSLDIEEILELPIGMPERLRLMADRSLEKDCRDNITIIAVVNYE